jgi:HK97 family phage portal protein
MGWINKTLSSLVNKSVAKAVNTDTFVPLNSYYDILGSYNSFDYSEYGDNKLINEGYASNTHLYAIINKLQNLSMNGKYKVMVNTPDGQEEDTTSDLYQLLQNPNENQTWDEFLEAAMTMLPVTGDLFLRGLAPIGMGNKITDLSVIPSNITDVVVSNSSYEVLGYQTTLYGKTTTYNTEEVFHGKLYNPTISGLEGHRGMSPLQAAYASLDTDNQIFNAKRNFYKNNGTNGIISSGSDVSTLGPDEAKQLDEALKRRIGGSSKANSLTVTGANVNYTAIGMPATSMQFLESGDVSLRDLCMVYGMDSKLFGDPKASTYNNQAEAAKGVWTNCIMPYNNRFVQYLNDYVTPGHSLADGKDYEIIYDTSHIEELQKDKKTEAEKNKIVIEGITSLVNSSLNDEAKVLMLTKLYDIEENEAQTLIESDESEPNTTEANESNEGTDTGTEEDNTEEQTQSNNN